MYIEGYSDSKILVVKSTDGRVLDVLDPSSSEYQAKKAKYKALVKADQCRLYCSCKYKRGENNEQIRYTIFENGSLQPSHKGNGIYHRPSCCHNSTFQKMYAYNAGFKVVVSNKKRYVDATLQNDLTEQTVSYRMADPSRLSVGAISPAAFFWYLISEQYEQYAFTTNAQYRKDQSLDDFMSYIKGSVQGTVVNNEEIFGSNPAAEAGIHMLDHIEDKTGDYVSLYLKDFALPGRERQKIKVKQNMFREAQNRFERGMGSLDIAMAKHKIPILVCYIKENLPIEWGISGKQYTHLSLIPLSKIGMPVESISEFYATLAIRQRIKEIKKPYKIYKPWQQEQSPFSDGNGKNYLPAIAVGYEGKPAYYFDLRYKNNRFLPNSEPQCFSKIPIITWDTAEHIDRFKETLKEQLI